jgi:hypothetical protein
LLPCHLNICFIRRNPLLIYQMCPARIISKIHGKEA